jgi:hypothetical protein
MHGPINVKSPNNTSKWQMGFNSALKGLNRICNIIHYKPLKSKLETSLAYIDLKIIDLGGEEISFAVVVQRNSLRLD